MTLVRGCGRTSCSWSSTRWKRKNCGLRRFVAAPDFRRSVDGGLIGPRSFRQSVQSVISISDSDLSNADACHTDCVQLFRGSAKDPWHQSVDRSVVPVLQSPILSLVLSRLDYGNATLAWLPIFICWTDCSRWWMSPRDWFMGRGSMTVWLHFSMICIGCVFRNVSRFGLPY